MITTDYSLKITFTEPILGTVGSDPETHAKYIANGATPEGLEEELATLPVQGRGTGFHMDGNNPALYDYAVRGFFKETCGNLRSIEGTRSSGKNVRAYKKLIDGALFVFPRLIRLKLSGPTFVVNRSLRAQTMQGLRVTLASSQAAPVGTSLTCTLKILDPKRISEDLLREWLDYGQMKGMGQWRSGSHGRFTYELALA